MVNRVIRDQSQATMLSMKGVEGGMRRDPRPGPRADNRQEMRERDPAISGRPSVMLDGPPRAKQRRTTHRGTGGGSQIRKRACRGTIGARGAGRGWCGICRAPAPGPMILQRVAVSAGDMVVVLMETGMGLGIKGGAERKDRAGRWVLGGWCWVRVRGILSRLIRRKSSVRL